MALDEKTEVIVVDRNFWHADAPAATTRPGDEARQTVVMKDPSMVLDDKTEVIVGGGGRFWHADAPPASTRPGDEARHVSLRRAALAATENTADIIPDDSVGQLADMVTATAKPGSWVREGSVEQSADESGSRSLVSSSRWKESSSGRSRLAMLMAAGVVVGGAWYILHSRGNPTGQAPHGAVAVCQPEKTGAARPESATRGSSPSAAPENGVEAASTANASDTASSPSAAPENAPTASEPPSNTDDVIVVTVIAVPADARFYRKGKAVSGSPMRVEVKRGARRVFEIGREGFHTRKVVVDGSQKKMTIKMRPEENTPPDRPAE